MRILVVDQCSGAKKGTDRSESLNEATVDNEPLSQLVAKEGIASYRAEELYQGRQQRKITEAIQSLEQAGDEVDRVFISAGFGLVNAEDELPLYDVTFADMSAAEIDARAERLGIHDALRSRIIDNEYDVVFFALGSDYYRSAKMEPLLPEIPEDTFVVLFNREELESGYDNVVSIPARTPQAKTYGTIVVALKGEYVYNFAFHRQTGTEMSDAEDVEKYCRREPASQTGLGDYSST